MRLAALGGIVLAPLKIEIRYVPMNPLTPPARPRNLNDLEIEADERYHQGGKLRDYSVATPSGTRVLFRNLEAELTREIRAAQMVVGCVAWLTSRTILAALADVPAGVMIVVQKEDFLRPDLDAPDDWKSRLRRQYDALKQPHERYRWPGMVGELSYARDGKLHPVRCVGNHNRDKEPAFPRMHHKFLVFCGVDDSAGGALKVTPRSVWTGSFNLTQNAANSLENAVLLHEPEAVSAYYREWEQVVALSEPLDWTDDWCTPYWRIGT